MQTELVSTPNYTEEDHQTWAALYERQMAQAADCACQEFFSGMWRLKLDPLRVPDKQTISARLQELTGWTLADAQNEYLSASEWYQHIDLYHFPVTNYIRRPEELDYTPLPDLFHEYFGHLALFTNPYFAETYHMFGPLYLSGNERQRLEISRISWFTTEFGLIRQNGEMKVIGAGLLSSPGELRHSLKPDTPRYEFDIRRVAQTSSAPYGYHEAYFILEDLAHLRRIIKDYARMEGLPIPTARDE